VDFLRYYAREVRQNFDESTHRPLGPVVCISPWNFPLAIFIGQISAALSSAERHERSITPCGRRVDAQCMMGEPAGSLARESGRLV
jgi:RHH-type proline utilization regulon transcriptional repressor/proline dehydrogenase/delta 1-pyrroline-5-carboxylate dehydrogenase